MARDNILSLQENEPSQEEEEGMKILTEEKLYGLYINTYRDKYSNYNYEEEEIGSGGVISNINFDKYIISSNIFKYKQLDEKIKSIRLCLLYENINNYDFSFLEYLPNLIELVLTYDTEDRLVKYKNSIIYTKLFEILQYTKNLKIIRLIFNLNYDKDEEFILTRELMKNLTNIKGLYSRGPNKFYFNEDSLLDMNNLIVLDGSFNFKVLSHELFINCSKIKHLSVICDSVEDDFIKNMNTYTNLINLHLKFKNIFKVKSSFLDYIKEDFVFELTNSEFELDKDKKNLFIKLERLFLVNCILNFKGSEEDLREYLNSFSKNIEEIYLGGILLQNMENKEERGFIQSFFSDKKF